MTRPIKHFGSSNFRNWIRRNAEVDSRDGYNLTDVDIVWENDLKEKWMVIEEKCKMATPKPKQVRLLRRIDTAGRRCSSFCGTHLVQFQNTSPDDGRVYFNGVEVSKAELTAILMFKLEPPEARWLKA